MNAPIPGLGAQHAAAYLADLLGEPAARQAPCRQWVIGETGTLAGHLPRGATWTDVADALHTWAGLLDNSRWAWGYHQGFVTFGRISVTGTRHGRPVEIVAHVDRLDATDRATLIALATSQEATTQ
ncbi:hypothetical protein [Thermoactinospora rubra]|uniref:hypothetical protein n=1 Tax=Thermoactinospora rubra TaxID=1088767 RepID=UPI000A122477|nr:hypothetical protein [Thermoactinospora rubra]